MIHILDPGRYLEAIIYTALEAAKARWEWEGHHHRCGLYRATTDGETRIERWAHDLGEWVLELDAPFKVREAARKAQGVAL